MGITKTDEGLPPEKIVSQNLPKKEETSGFGIEAVKQEVKRQIIPKRPVSPSILVSESESLTAIAETNSQGTFVCFRWWGTSSAASTRIRHNLLAAG